MIGKETFGKNNSGEIKIPGRVIKLAKLSADRSQHRFRLGAVIFNGREVMGKGWNNACKTHPRSPTPYNTIHAEFAAIADALYDVKGCDIYVHRLLADGRPGLARPCTKCMKMLVDAGIRNIYFSIEE